MHWDKSLSLPDWTKMAEVRDRVPFALGSGLDRAYHKANEAQRLTMHSATEAYLSGIIAVRLV